MKTLRVEELCRENSFVCDYCRRWWLQGECCLFYKRVLCVHDNGVVEVRPTWLKRVMDSGADSN